MFRRYSPLVAVFLLSGLLTRAGLADASDDPDSDPTPDPSLDGVPEPAPVSASVLALLERGPATVAEVEGSWPEQVNRRLAASSAVDRETRPTHDPRLRARVDRALAGLGGRVGVEIRDLDSGAVLLARDAHRSLNPASNQKLVTAIAAVELLGPDYHFETTVSREGDALILRGQGDPDLHVRDLHRLASEVAAAHPRALDGVRRVLVDDSAFDSRTLGPGFRSDGPGDSYIAPSGALALDYGTVKISVSPGAYRRPAQIHIEPASAAIEIHNDTHTGAGSLSVTTRAGEHGRTIVTVSGAIPAGHQPITLRRRVTDPGLVAGATFAELLRAHTGGAALPVARGLASPEAELLARHESEPLVAVLASALRYSNNFTAEQVLRTLAWRASGEPGSWAGGAKILARFAEAVSPSRAGAQRFVNGSGLSREGRLSPSFLVDVLSLARRPASPAQALLSSFAKAGGEGTLRNRLPHAGARVMAKTGTYANASSLSGMVHDATGARSLGFCVIVNGGDLERNRGAQDRVVAALLRALQ